MRIACVIAVHGRGKIAKLTIKRLQERQCCDIDVVLAGDSDCDAMLAHDTNSYYVDAGSNKPLSKKWQAGFNMARNLDPDAVLVMGSDDWITDDWVKYAWRKLHEYDVDLVGRMEWDIGLVRPNREMVIKHQMFIDERKIRPIGAGRLFSRQILDKLDWQLFTFRASKNTGLDLASFQKMRSVGGTWKLLTGPMAPRLLLIRADWYCVNPWEKLTGDLPGLSTGTYLRYPQQWMNNYFPKGYEQLKRMVNNE